MVYIETACVCVGILKGKWKRKKEEAPIYGWVLGGTDSIRFRQGAEFANNDPNKN